MVIFLCEKLRKNTNKKEKDRKSSGNNYNLKTQEELAIVLGISIPTFQNYKQLAENDDFSTISPSGRRNRYFWV